jgi:hypothetical protein
MNKIEFPLPPPWAGELYELPPLGPVNFLVGPNGSGKSKFADMLRQVMPGARLLSTDRLLGMEIVPPIGFFNNQLQLGLRKDTFPHYRAAGNLGLGVDAFVLLEERLDLKIRIEATLSHLFDRNISLEWDSGMLFPKATLGSFGASYRLDTEECHGIKELLVLLTHLYNDADPFLIIDEPEQNLHPQLQAFFMQEVRRITGDPSAGTGNKVVILVTHSPFILDFKSVDDLKSVISFDLKRSPPRSLSNLDTDAAQRLASLIPKINVHHKQLFFSDNPIFVEGIWDAQMVQMIQEVRGVSLAGAGSCVIELGGCEEVNKYLVLCQALGKRAYFLYDLDSLFHGNLRGCVKADETIGSFLATLGLGNNFSKYCGQIDRELSQIITTLRANAATLPSITELLSFLHSLADGSDFSTENLRRARVAVLVQLHRDRESLVNATSRQTVQSIEGRLKQIANILQQKNVFLLTGGALEHYLPSYQGNKFKLDDSAKQKAVGGEMDYLRSPRNETELRERYGDLFETRAPAWKATG